MPERPRSGLGPAADGVPLGAPGVGGRRASAIGGISYRQGYKVMTLSAHDARTGELTYLELLADLLRG